MAKPGDRTRRTKVTMLLADSVQAVQGKLYILGGGWSITGPEPSPSALAIKLDVPWEEANRKYSFRCALLNGDDRPVLIEGTAIEFSGQFEAGRPAGLKPGSPLDVALGINIGPLPLAPDNRYVWRFFIGEDTDDDWEVAFTTRAQKG